MSTKNNITYMVASRDTTKYSIRVITSSEEEAREVWSREYPKFEKKTKSVNKAILLVKLFDLTNKDIQMLEDSKTDLKVAAKNDLYIQRLVDKGDCLEYYEPEELEESMNVATYVYIVHSDINENNIYAEFATEEEAIDYARRHKDELTYVDKVDAALDKDGEILEIFDERTIWVYDEEDEEEDEEEINEFDTDFEDDESEGWSVCVVTPDDGDSDWEHFDSESEARDYFDNYTSYESGREVEVQLYGPDGMEDSYTIGADEDLDESLLEKITISEGIKLRTKEEQDEFFQLCDEIGIITAKDIINFKKEVGCTDENILQALRDYRAELGPDFKIADPELEREMAKKYEDIDFDGLVEELEEHEDMVECKECYDLVAKESCHKNKDGKYVCEKCAGTLEEAFTKPIFFTHTAYGPYKIRYFDGGFDAGLKSQQIYWDPNMRIRIAKTLEGEKPSYEFMTLGEFADLLDAEGIKYIGQKSRKPITEEVSSGLTPEQLAAMNAYLRTGKDLYLEDYEEEHADFAIDIVGGELTYNSKTNDFTFYLSIYHASEDNNAEYPEYHTDEEEYSFDTIEEVYDEFPQYLEDIYNWNFVKTEAIKMTRDELLDKEGTTDVELINAGRPEEERVELVELVDTEDRLEPHTVVARVER